jgi:hypothetical protein
VVVGREPAVGTVFVPQLLDSAVAVELDDVVTAAALDQLDLGAGKLLLDVCGQTGRARLVASNDAVLDRHPHGVLIAWRPGQARARVRR